MITVRNVTKTYQLGKKSVQILKGCSFRVEAGKFFAIMGPSGSGKSTLLYQLGLLDKPTSGNVILDNTLMTHLSEERKREFRLRKLGYIFQEYALLPELTAIDNVMLPSLATGKPVFSARKKAFHLLELVGLSHRVHHHPSELSGGEQQRVAIARCLVNEPKIIFADEPCANLDSKASKQVLEIFYKLNKERKQTIVMVTHEEWHKPYVDEVIRLKDGLIESIESIREKKKVMSAPRKSGNYKILRLLKQTHAFLKKSRRRDAKKNYLILYEQVDSIKDPSLKKQVFTEMTQIYHALTGKKRSVSSASRKRRN